MKQDAKNARKRAIRQAKKSGTFVNKNSIEYRAQNFVTKAAQVHGETYTYEKVNYTGAHTHVEIFCTKHGGYFMQSPTSHLSGNGCDICGIKAVANSKRIDTAEFISRATKVHGNKYDYTLVDYRGCFEPVTVICREHGPKTMIPAHHLQDRGCPECAKNGYRTELPGTLYVLTVGNTTKVGITNIEVKERIRQISKSADKKFSLLTKWEFEDGSVCAEHERRVLSELRGKYKTTDERYNGWTESFLDVDRAFLVQHIEELITQGTA